MLGHKVYQYFEERFDTYTTLRRSQSGLSRLSLYRDSAHVIDDVDAMDFERVRAIVDDVRPTVIVNCIGVIKQVGEAREAVPLIQLNSLFPHRLVGAAAAIGARLIHVSTDCVFSGRKGQYSELDLADPPDLYGQSKLLGEVRGPNCLTIRTSVIGRDFTKNAGLLEWFISQQGKSVQGYVNSIYSGFTTQALAVILAFIVERQPELQGLYHVASNSISKYELLVSINNAMNLGIEVERFENALCDRSLDGQRFIAATKYQIHSWEEMIAQIAGDTTPYDRWKHELTAA